MSVERTLVILKPDAVEKGVANEIIARITDTGLTTAGEFKGTPNRYKVEQHYDEHKGKSFYDGLVNFLCSGDCIFLIVKGENAIERVRKMMGSYKDPEKGTIRGDFAESQMRNCIHASDSKESAEREIAIWFTDLVNRPPYVPPGEEVKQ